MITLVLGGARSGKSAYAEALAERAGGAVTYLATGVSTDPDMAARIARHRLRRPPGWVTIEAGAELPDVLPDLAGTVLIDALGTWLARCPGFVVDADGLCAILRARAGHTIVVSEEVGLGVHPETPAGCAFRDALGDLNRTVASVAARAVLIVAGRPLPLGPPPDPGPAGA